MKILRTMAALIALSGTASGCSDVDAPQDEDSLEHAPPRARAHGQALASELSEVAITTIRTEGDCATEAIVADDGHAGEVRFSRFEAALAPGAREARARCDLHVAVTTPPGHSYALEELSVEGTVTLAAQATARLEADYRFGEAAARASRAKEFLGPVDGPLVFFADFADGDRTFGHCHTGGDLTVRLRLDVRNPNAIEAGRLALTRFRPLRIAVRPCPPVASN
ncbi:MAG: DUF4360 domain-containing protein [Polyangiales bacterium]